MHGPVKESPLFFEGPASLLFGVLHEPVSGGPPRTPFVFCHPFAEEKLWAHRVFVTFGRELAARGHTVLRVDHRGNGDSAGDFTDYSVEGGVADIHSAMDLVRRRTGATAVGLLGLRFGATLASLAAESRPDVALLVLWAPLVDGNQYMQELLRSNLTTQMAIYREIRADREALTKDLLAGGTANVDGYELTQILFEQASAINLTRDVGRFRGPCLVVQVDRAEKARPRPELDALRGRYADATGVMVQEDLFWKEIDTFYDRAPNLFATTLDWLEQR